MRMDPNISRLISILYRKNQVYISHSLRVYGVSAAEQPFLVYLYDKDGATQEEMAAYLNIDKAAAARSVRSLIEKGFVTKSRDEIDRRCNRIRLTQKAMGCKDEIILRLGLWNVFLMEGMDHAEKEAAFGAISKMAAKVDGIDFRKEWNE